MHEVHAIVSGFVQGVNFRYYTVMHAKSLGLRGYVRNLSDGRVEVVAQGEKEELERLVDWLRDGPSSASVEDVEIGWSKPAKKYEGFQAKY